LIDLDQQMRSILAQLELLAHGTITNYSPTGGGHSADTKPPTGESRPPHLHWRERWERAVRDDEEWTIDRELVNCEEIIKHRKDVIEKAQADLDSYRKRTEGVVVGETEEELEARIVREGEGWSVEQVAQHCRCTVTFARKARLKAGVSVATGKRPDGLKVDSSDQSMRVREYAANGYTERGIALLTGLSKSTIRRLVGKAA
jgi:hypothetical protein